MSRIDVAGGFLLDGATASTRPSRARDEERAGARRWTRAATLAAFGALTLFAFCVAGAWYFTGAVVPWDSKNHFYPMFRFLADGLARGEIPWWNPYHFGGHPAAADPQSLIFTPTMFLFALVAPGASMQAFDIAIHAHLLLGGFAILGLFRRRGWHPAGAVLAAMMFIIGGPAASRLQHTGMIISYAWFPVAILALEIALARVSLLFAAVFGVAAACMALGRDQVAFLGCFSLIFLVLHEAATSGQPLRWLARRWLVLAIAGVTGGALLAIPSLLTMQFLADSNRPEIAYGVAAAGSLAPQNFITMFAPNFFGSINWSYDYWGPGYETTPTPDHTDRAINYLFLGTAPALLLLWQGCAGLRLADRSARFFAIVATITLLYSVGRATPLFTAAFDSVPGVRLYRRPADATFVMCFAFAVLAGYLLHRFVADGLPRPFLGRGRLAAIVTIFAPVALVAALTGSALAFSAAQDHLDFSLREAALAAFAFTLVATILVAGRRKSRRAGAAALLVALTGAELVWRNAAVSINAEPAARYVYDTMPAAQAAGLDALRRDMATRKEAGVPPRVEILGLPGGWQNASMVFGLQDTLGYNPLRISAYGRAVGPGENAVDPNSRKFPGTFRGYTCTLARLLGLEYLVLDRPLARLPRHVPRPRVTPVHSADGMYVYRLRDPAARAYLATTIRPVASDDAIAASDIPEFDMAREALIDEASMSLVGGAYAQGAGETASSRVNITRYGLNRVEIDVESDRAGVLVLHDLYYPGWTVKVDGETRPVLRANLLFRGVEVGAGRHSIVFEFAPLTLANLAAAARTALHAGEE